MIYRPSRPSAAKFILLIGAMVIASIAAANTEWIVSSRNCDDFAKGVLKTLDDVKDAPPSEEQKADIKEILKSACNPPFDTCNFSICQQTQASGTTATIPVPEATPDLAAEISWLRNDITCAEFMKELRSRYSGRRQELSDPERKELQILLDLACGDRFRGCNFEACKGRTRP